MKLTGMLVVSLGGVNCRFWSHLGYLGWKVTIFAHSGIHVGPHSLLCWANNVGSRNS